MKKMLTHVTIDGADFMVNMYNANSEIEQIQVLNISPILPDSLDIDQNKQGAFSLFPGTTLDAKSVNLLFKKRNH